jgi:hypothetical protein
VAAHLGGGRIYAQEFARQFKAAAVGEGDFQDAGLLVQLDFRRLRGILSAHAKFLDCKTKIVPDKPMA